MEESELFEGLKVNVLDDGLQVVEPDVLVDISAIAACFQDYGHHPLAYLINRLKPSANTSPILLGNFAGTALDQIIHDPEADFGDMLRASFSEQALQFCTCEDFNPVKFKTDALRQVNNASTAWRMLFTWCKASVLNLAGLKSSQVQNCRACSLNEVRSMSPKSAAGS